MSCDRCIDFGKTLVIRGSAELESIVERVRQAVADGMLEYDAFEADPAFVAQPSFLTLDLGGPWPDVMQYHFNCTGCGQGFRLAVEAYHGPSGSWTPVAGDES